MKNLMNSYTNSIYNILQVLHLIHILLIVDFFVSYLLDQFTFILKLVLGCDIKSSVGRIQTGHTDLLLT